MRGLTILAAVCVAAGGIAACARKGAEPESAAEGAAQAAGAAVAARVDDARIRNADRESGNWMSYGRTYDEQRYSPLDRIGAANVGTLGLAWYYDLDTAARAQESTPLVIDGVMYVTSAWSKVFALDAATGRELWRYDPKVPGAAGINACCDVVNRGVAAWEGRLYLGTLDGRLVAIDAETGKPAWEVMTVEPGSRYTITGAPRVVKGKVIIGNGGGEMGVRGYVTAYDAATGQQVWRFYTVPGDPSKPFENPALELAAKTWKGEWWKLGGGGTVWDSMAYDPDLDLLYIGTGNGSPWNRAIRSPGGGDNLFISSIVALKPESGEYVWHYQTTPGDTWDYTAAQHMILADLTIEGRARKVIMQAPKNGFFYVLDRATGELISASAFATMNWAKGIDMKTGRPIETAEARYGETGRPFIAQPGPGGAHSWQPMSYSPRTGLVYFPVMEAVFPYFPDKDFRKRTLAWNTGVDFNAGSLPTDQGILDQIKAGLKGHLVAWDPVGQREVWRVQHEHPWNGGALSTAGDVVFHGDALGEFAAYDARTGAKLWSVATGTGILAPPDDLPGRRRAVRRDRGGLGRRVRVRRRRARPRRAHRDKRTARLCLQARRNSRDAAARTAAAADFGTASRRRDGGDRRGGQGHVSPVLRHLPRRLRRELGRAAGSATLGVSQRTRHVHPPGARGHACRPRHVRLRAGALGRGCRADPRVRDPPRTRNEACGCGRGRTFRRKAGVNRDTSRRPGRGDG